MMHVLVEGADDELAIPTMVRRDRGNLSIRCINMQGKPNIVRRNRGFEDTVRRQHILGAKAFIVLMDSDVFYPPHSSLDDERRDMADRAQALSNELRIAIWVCWAVPEMESWLIAGLRPGVAYCGLRNVGRIPVNTEATPQDPKSWLQDHLRVDYQPRTAECLARHIDLAQARQRNISLVSFLSQFA